MGLFNSLGKFDLDKLAEKAAKFTGDALNDAIGAAKEIHEKAMAEVEAKGLIYPQNNDSAQAAPATQPVPAPAQETVKTERTSYNNDDQGYRGDRWVEEPYWDESGREYTYKFLLDKRFHKVDVGCVGEYVFCYSYTPDIMDDNAILDIDDYNSEAPEISMMHNDAALTAVQTYINTNFRRVPGYIIEAVNDNPTFKYRSTHTDFGKQFICFHHENPDGQLVQYLLTVPRSVNNTPAGKITLNAFTASRKSFTMN